MSKLNKTALLLTTALVVLLVWSVRVDANQKNEGAKSQSEKAKSQSQSEKIVATLSKLIATDEDAELRVQAIDAMVTMYQSTSDEKVQDAVIDALLGVVENVENDSKIRSKAIEGILYIMEDIGDE